MYAEKFRLDGRTALITGGFNGAAYLTSAERLDPRVGAWQPVCASLLLNPNPASLPVKAA